MHIIRSYYPALKPEIASFSCCKVTLTYASALIVLILTIAKPDSSADVLLDAFNLALLKYSFRQDKAVVVCWLDIWLT